MRHDDLLGEDVLQEEADNVRQVVMEKARLNPESSKLCCYGMLDLDAMFGPL